MHAFLFKIIRKPQNTIPHMNNDCCIDSHLATNDNLDANRSSICMNLYCNVFMIHVDNNQLSS